MISLIIILVDILFCALFIMGKYVRYKMLLYSIALRSH